MGHINEFKVYNNNSLVIDLDVDSDQAVGHMFINKVDGWLVGGLYGDSATASMNVVVDPDGKTFHGLYLIDQTKYRIEKRKVSDGSLLNSITYETSASTTIGYPKYLDSDSRGYSYIPLETAYQFVDRATYGGSEDAVLIREKL